MISNRIADADRAVALGRLDEAEKICESILEEEPQNPTARLLRGVIFVKRGQFEAALAELGAIADGTPEAGRAIVWTSRALRRLGRPAEAFAAAQVAAVLEPDNPAAQHQLGVCALETRQYDVAVDAFSRAIAGDPQAATLHHGRGLALYSLGRNSEAIHAFRRAAEFAPGALPVLVSLHQALSDESDWEGVLDCTRRMYALSPGSAEASLRLAGALVANNLAVEAEIHLQAALRQGSSEAGFHFAAGTVLQGLGRTVESEAEFRRSLERDPDQGFAYAAIAYSRKLGEPDRPLLEQMSRASHDGRVPADQLAHLEFGLGKAFQDLGDFELAMKHFDEANRRSYEARYGERPFDRDQYAASVDAVIRRYDLESAPAKPEGAGSPSDRPVFVVGMLRSGTTLVEQILSAHSDAASGGEQGFWMQHRGAAVDQVDELRALASAYLERLGRISPSASRVIDKMPDNYREIGLIHRAFPRAKIIHCMRHPADTCLSIFTTINRIRLDWTGRKEDIVFVYRQYQRLVEHWRRWLPPGSMLDVSYEELIGHRERVTRQMLEFCGLEWDDACMRPEENPRAVATPSVWQVRQPVYASSVGRWRNYEPWLGAFGELVG